MNWVLKWKTGRESISGLFPVFIVKRKVFLRRKEKDRVLGSGVRVYRLSGDSATMLSSSGTQNIRRICIQGIYLYKYNAGLRTTTLSACASERGCWV